LPPRTARSRSKGTAAIRGSRWRFCRIATPGVEINKLFRLVRDDVIETTAGRQEPYTYGSLPGKEEFFFVEK
jgi:hypothetical protein